MCIQFDMDTITRLIYEEHERYKSITKKVDGYLLTQFSKKIVKSLTPLPAKTAHEEPDTCKASDGNNFY